MRAAGKSARVHTRRTMGIRMTLFTKERLFWQCGNPADQISQVLRVLSPISPSEFSGTAPTFPFPFLVPVQKQKVLRGSVICLGG